MFSLCWFVYFILLFPAQSQPYIKIKKNLCPYIEIVIQFNSPMEGIRGYHKIRLFEFHLSSNSLRNKVIYKYL
jgi:hypothetical protein